MAVIVTIVNMVTVLIGFSLIIVIHELGHFLAARWAGVRVLAFAVGFGSPLLTFRKGLGWRRHSTEQEAKDRIAAGETEISTTEYRLNALPLGGYVKMLGQDDADPSHRSDAPDSFNTAPVWKRMVIISAGVVFNLITAAIMFVVVFSIGMKTEAPVVGTVFRDGPSLAAPVFDASGAQVGTGLRPGDEILAVDSERIRSFNGIAAAAAMTAPDAERRVAIRRDGQELEARIKPQKDETANFFQFGFAIAASTTLNPGIATNPGTLDEIPNRHWYEALPAGATITSVDQAPVESLAELRAALRPGVPATLAFEHPEGGGSLTVSPVPQWQVSLIKKDETTRTPFRHMLGMTPVMSVGKIGDASVSALKAGLREGDIFVRLGDVEYPSTLDGIAQIGAHKGRTIAAKVMRVDGGGAETFVDLELPVDKRRGTVGFRPGLSEIPLLARVPRGTLNQRSEPESLAASGVLQHTGARVVSVGGVPVSSFSEILDQLQRATRDAWQSGTASAVVDLGVRWPLSNEGEPVEEVVQLPLDAGSLEELHALGWTLPDDDLIFTPIYTTMRGEGVLDSMVLGVSETKRVMISTYLTFVRLGQGTITIESLNGPIGIVHIGTMLASRGAIWMLFFFALVSVNLAVINFLPVPITDGGQAIFLAWEQVTGRPVSILVQNVATLAGLALIGSMFLIVTFNDIKRILGL